MAIALLTFISLALMTASTWRPAAAIGGLLCLFGIKQFLESLDPLFIIYSAIPNYAMGIVFLWAIINQAFRKPMFWKDYPANGWLSLLLLAWAMVSILWTPATDMATHLWLTQGIYIVVFAILSPLLIADRSDAQDALIATITLGSVLIVLLLSFASWSGRGISLAEGVVNVRNEAIESGNPLALADLAMYVLIPVVLMNFRSVHRIWAIVRWPLVIAAMIVVVRSGSRGQFIAGLLAVVFMLPFSRRLVGFKPFVVVFTAVLLLGFIASWLLESQGGEGRWSFEHMQSAYEEGRLSLVGVLLEVWSGNLMTVLFGLGNSASFSILGIYPHVVPAEVLCEEGVVGLIIYLALNYVTARDIIRGRKAVIASSVDRGILAALAALFIFRFIISTKEGNLIDAENFMFPIMVGRFLITTKMPHVAAESTAIPEEHMVLSH